MNRRGFTLIELLVGIVLVGIVGSAIYQVLLNSQRVYTLQTERAAMNQNNRAAVAILPSEFRELNPSDTIESDILDMSATSIEYKAMRGLFLVCAVPVDNGTSGTVVVESQGYGLRWWIENGRDSVVVFAEGSPASRLDNHWVHANVSTAGSGTCRGGQTGMQLALTNVTPEGGLANVTPGAPLRTFEMMRILSYTDVAGDMWLGAQTREKGGGWSTTQPMLGPLAPRGLLLTYLDTDGAATTNEAEVAQIDMTVIGQTTGPVRGASGMAPAVDTLVTAVAPRNGIRDN